MTPEQYFEYSKQNFDSLHDSLSELHGIVRKHSEQLEKDAEAIRALAGHAARAWEAIERLSNIAISHEQRLGDLEGGDQPQG